MYTIFAITMVVTGFAALLIAVFNFNYARREVQLAHALCDRLVAAEADRQMLRSKIDQALAERIRALETYRRTHTERLNELEDLVELLNTGASADFERHQPGEYLDAQPDERSEVGARSSSLERTMASIDRAMDSLVVSEHKLDVGCTFTVRDMTDAEKLNECYQNTLDHYRTVGRY